jgi:hypothetical protein
MMKEINPDFGFQSVRHTSRPDLTGKLQSIALVSVRKRFSPEFVNRIDAIITYQPLTVESLSAILDNKSPIFKHVNTRLGSLVHPRGPPNLASSSSRRAPALSTAPAS